jgi:2-oxo-4-hydroxy-4-carboxy--5-ureidoimidazoline (OHCU) decarboxylase
MSWDAFQREALAELGHVVYMPLRAATAGARAVDVDAAMLARLARAAGVEADALLAHPDIAGLTAALRGNAAAKRALWPRLRALRRNAR